MSWPSYLGSIAFFFLLLTVFFWVAWSVLLGIYENYLRYYQKAELQWTGRESRFPKRRPQLPWILAAALLSSWLIVHWIILPG